MQRARGATRHHDHPRGRPARTRVCPARRAIPELAVPGTPPQRSPPTGDCSGARSRHSPGAMRIIETLLGEATDALPSPYLHIGGDEADPTMLARFGRGAPYATQHGGIERLRGVVNAQLATMILDLGRTPIAWDDAYVAGGLPTRDHRHAAALGRAWPARCGCRARRDRWHRSCPPTSTTPRPPALTNRGDRGAATVADVASWTPPRPPDGSAGQVLGGQAQLWAEYTPDLGAREYRAFPRRACWRPTCGAAHRPTSPRSPRRCWHSSIGGGPACQRPPAGRPAPRQRTGTGRRSPVGSPDGRGLAYLDLAAAYSEPPPM